MPRRPDKKIIIAISVTTFVVLVSAWLVIFLLGNKVRRSFESYQKEKLNSFVLEEKRNKILKLKRELPDLEMRKSSLDSMLIKKDEAVPFLRILEKIAGEASCSIKIEPTDISKIKFEKTAPSTQKNQDEDELDALKKENKEQASGEKNKKEDELASLKNYPAFSIEATGHFSSIIDFFDKLENIPFFVRPLIIDVNNDKKSNTGTVGQGALATGTSTPSEPQERDEKDIKMTITFVVYGN